MKAPLALSVTAFAAVGMLTAPSLVSAHCVICKKECPPGNGTSTFCDASNPPTLGCGGYCPPPDDEPVLPEAMRIDDVVSQRYVLYLPNDCPNLSPFAITDLPFVLI